MAITKKMRKELNRNQFGEQAAVQMYSMLAKRMKDPRDAAAMERLSKDEARHAFAFRALTGNEVPPFPLLGVGVTLLYRIVGKKTLFRLMAKAEYAAEKGYRHLIPQFPELDAVRADEGKHGDALMKLAGESGNRQ